MSAGSKKDQLASLAQRILDDRTGQLTAAELDALLTWLAGGERRGAGVLIKQLGPAGDQPRLLRQVYEDLDDALFSPDGLEVEAAFVSAREEDGVRKARYRRLMNAFHPDRFDEHADWLTSRSQYIHAAYQAFRRPEPAAAPAASPPQKAETGTYRPPNPRGSARLTPSEPGPLRRLRWRLRNVEHLQAKILGGLAALLLVPLLLIYLFGSAPAPRSESSARTAALTEPPTPAPAAGDQAPAAPAQAEPAGAIGMNNSSNADSIESAGKTESGPDTTSEPRRTTPVEPIAEPESSNPALEQALAAEMDLSETRFEPPAPPRTEPQQAPAPARQQPPQPEPTPAPAESSPEPFNPNPEPQEPNPAPQTTAPQPATEPTPRKPPEAQPAAANTTGTTEPSMPSPETREPPAPPEPAPIETRVASVLSAYETAFTEGDINGFMAVLADNPRENKNRGRNWFRSSYEKLFKESSSRRLEVSVARIEPTPEGWQVTALFELWVAYPNRSATHAEQMIRYGLEEDASGQLRIASIDY